MAGRPKHRAMLSELDRLTGEYFEHEGPARTHLDYAEARIMSGSSIQGIAAELSAKLGFQVDRETLRRHLYDVGNNDGSGVPPRERLTRAREEGAFAAAEATMTIADGPLEDVAAGRLQVSARQWIAEKWNAQAFGQRQSPNVTINLGSLHLAAISREPNKVTSGDAMKALPSSDAVVLPSKSNE